jgi:hypothetical protein
MARTDRSTRAIWARNAYHQRKARHEREGLPTWRARRLARASVRADLIRAASAAAAGYLPPTPTRRAQLDA